MYKTLIEKYYTWSAKRRLTHQYRYLNAVNNILEGYLTKRILDGGSQEFTSKGRQDLVNKQNEIKENQNFINYIKSVK